MSHPPDYFEREYFQLHPGKVRYLDWLVGLLRRHGVGSGRVLDVGAGYGFLMEALARAGYETAGIELSPEAAELARQRTGREVATGSAEAAFPFADGRFEAVTMLDVIEHLRAYGDALAECRRVLAPGGKLFVITLNSGSAARPILRKSWSWYLDSTHVHMFSGRMLREGLEQAGFQVERLTTMSNFCSVGEGNPVLKPLRRIGRVVTTPWFGDSLLAVGRKR